MTSISEYWKKEYEKKKKFQELQNIYKNEVMKYRLEKIAGEQYFQPITDRLDKTIEPLKQLEELSDEQSKRMFLPEPIPLAIDDGRTGVEGAEWPEEDDDEFEEAPEVTHRGPEWKFRPDENVSEVTLKVFNLEPPSVMKGRPMEEKEEIRKYLKSQKGKLTRDINQIKKEGGDPSVLEKMQKMRQELDNYTDIIILDKLKVGEGYKIRRNGQYGSSYIDIPLLEKRRILRVIDGYGNPLLNGKINKDFIDLITKRFNSKKKHKGSSIEAFKLLNKLPSMPLNKRSKKVTSVVFSTK